MNNEYLEVVEKAKLLGVIITNDLKWDDNTAELVRRSNARLALLRKVASFSSSIEDMKLIYILYIRSILEQSCVVWHSRLTVENTDDIEIIQKCALKIILGNKYKTYEQALEITDLQTLNERREQLCLSFAKKCLNNPKTKSMFQLQEKIHQMPKRKEETFLVNHANTKRLQISSIPYMQRLLNQDKQTMKDPG